MQREKSFFPNSHREDSPVHREVSHRQIFAILMIFVSVATAVFIYSNYSDILASFTGIEEENVVYYLDELSSDLVKESRRISIAVQNYAEWDRFRAYVSGENPGFFEKELSPVTIGTLGIRYLLVTRTDGTVLHAGKYDREGRYMSLNRSELFIPDTNHPIGQPALGWFDDGTCILIGSSQVYDTTGKKAGFLVTGTDIMEIPWQPPAREWDLSTMHINQSPGSMQGLPWIPVTAFFSKVTRSSGKIAEGAVYADTISGPEIPLFTITLQPDPYSRSATFGTTYLIQAIIFSAIIIIFAYFLTTNVFRRFDQTSGKLREREKEVEFLNEKRILSERLQKIVDTYLRFGPDGERNISILISLSKELSGADYAIYYRIENDRIQPAASWNLPFSIREQAGRNVSRVEEFCTVIREKGTCIIHEEEIRTLDLTVGLPDQDPIRMIIGASIRSQEHYYGCLILFFHNPAEITDFDQIIINLLSNTLSIEEWRNTSKDDLQKREAILESINYGAICLLNKLGISSVRDVIWKLGVTLEVEETHLYLFEHHENNQCTIAQDYEWSDDPLYEQRKYPDFAELFNNHSFPRWDEFISKGMSFFGSDESLPPDQKEYLALAELRSIGIIPIFTGDQSFGLLCLMERSHSREWGKTEKDTICAAAGLLGATFSRITQEDEIKRREDNFRHFFNTIDDYVFVLEPSGEIVEMNHAASRTLNGEREPVTGTTLSSFIIHEYRETFLADLDLSAKGAKISRQSSLFISGSRITVEMLLVNGVWNEKRRIYCICKDISEIMASREKFSQVFHSSHAMHTIRRVSDHTLIDVNETYLKTLGYSREEVFEHAQTEACSDPLQYQMIWEEVCRKGALRDAELNLHTRDGRIIYGLYNGVIIDVNGDSCVLSTIMNISKIMQAERRVHDLLEELSLSNRDLEEFAYIVSHDLKAPLRGITSLILWLEDDPLNSFSDKGKTYLKTLSERVTYMQRLIDGILAYSRAGKRIEEKQPVDSGDLVMEVIHLLSPPDSLTIHIPGNLPVVLIERMKLFQVFQNLIGNAITYISRPDGVITITASEKKTGITFCIEDNGPGIHPDFHDRIFEMFSRFQEPSFESTGLGLSIVKRIVEMNGGRVWVESEPGKGSRFFFFIPQ